MTSRYALWHGVDAPPQELRPLRAGELECVVDGVDLRYVTAGGVEVVRRIYAAVRDRNWNTIPGAIESYELDDRGDSFEARFTVRHRSHDVDFVWDGAIAGGVDARIAVSLDGRAEREMLYNRIGFCVLHPFRETRGRPYRARTPDGEITGEFPRLIGEQGFADGFYVPLFPSFDGLEVDLEGGGLVRFEFEGDLWEDEDQRNWTDASFKTYCTPLKLGFPHRLEPGDRIQQRVVVSVEGVPARRADTEQEVVLRVGDALGRKLPRLGLGSASDGKPLSEHELALVRDLGLDHLRADVHLGSTGWQAVVRRALEDAARLGWGLELALQLREEDAERLDELRGLLEGARVDRVLAILHGGQTATPEETTPPSLVGLVRERLGTEVVAGGTDMYFTELNRTRPQADEPDAIFYSIVAQIHAFDDVSVVETLEAQAETVESAHAFAEGKPVVVSPVTLRRRSNPHATAEEVGPAPGELPDAVDPRQLSLLGAAWTAGSIKYLAASGAASVTYFETAGWRGVVERESGSPLPERFPSRPGQVFPLYHVLADAGEWKDAELLECNSTRPLDVVGLAVRQNGSVSLLVANLKADPVTARIEGIDGAGIVQRLDERSAPERAEAERVEDVSRLELSPFETVRIDS
jgi:hypothetical protein